MRCWFHGGGEGGIPGGIFQGPSDAILEANGVWGVAKGSDGHAPAWPAPGSFQITEQVSDGTGKRRYGIIESQGRRRWDVMSMSTGDDMSSVYIGHEAKG
ncbi:hypothetical protein VTJ04DRAFT_7879 [Mycothermus thermophilus]|uniref:uncharacterized protein n=1 Tax=Humicola insolens TaxID=85995 RepID=UPI0037442319